MIKRLLLLSVVMIAAFSCDEKKDLVMWYKQPAAVWTEALPVGNGRIGGMVFGGVGQERIQLNEESLWAGSKINNNNPEARLHLAEIQQAIFNGEYRKADQLSNRYLLGTPPRVRSYQPLGDMFIKFGLKGKPQSYRRSLTLNTGIARTEYEADGIKVTEEVFSSAPANALVVILKTNKPVSAEISISRECDTIREFKGRRNFSWPMYENDYHSENGTAWYNGQIIDNDSPLEGPGGRHMRYSAVMKVSSDGSSEPLVTGNSAGYAIGSAKTIVILFTGATDYNAEKLDVDQNIDPLALCRQIIETASGKDARELKAEHESDHRSFFDRVDFGFNAADTSTLATDERLKLVKEGRTDDWMVPLYYQYGRYLLMGSSRKPGRLPANLQGIWNDLWKAPWNADFHTNINLQMNYWHAESGNLPETSVILSDFMSRLMVPGAVTASEMYGARGWTIHHLTDPFGRTGVADGVWGITPMDGPWMTFPVYEHFQYTRDTDFLRTVAFPMIKGSVEFVLDFLVKSPEGYLVTNPSHSPENSFFVPNTDRKERSQMTYAPTVDIHTVNALFNNFIESAAILGTENDLVEKVRAAQKLIPPLKVAANGTLQEWIEDYEEVEPGHRHMSHLLGLYPLDLISRKTPGFLEASVKTLEKRLSSGGGHTGWSRAWIINLYARLDDPEKANEHLYALLRKSTLPNLFDTHPPFQIDGNFGGSAGIAEMLLQSQGGEINLLPALPASWPDGYITGLRARGAYTIDLYWEKGLLKKARIKSDKGGKIIVRYKDRTVGTDLKPGEIAVLNEMLVKV